MSHQHTAAHDSRERRLREIEAELAALRKEQRLFRRVGFGENLKAMQIIALQMEMREHVDALPAGHGESYSDNELVRLRVTLGCAIERAAIALAMSVAIARALPGLASRPRAARRSFAHRLGHALAAPMAHGRGLD